MPEERQKNQWVEEKDCFPWLVQAGNRPRKQPREQRWEWLGGEMMAGLRIPRWRGAFGVSRRGRMPSREKALRERRAGECRRKGGGGQPVEVRVRFRELEPFGKWLGGWLAECRPERKKVAELNSPCQGGAFGAGERQYPVGAPQESWRMVGWGAGQDEAGERVQQPVPVGKLPGGWSPELRPKWFWKIPAPNWLLHRQAAMPGKKRVEQASPPEKNLSGGQRAPEWVTEPDDEGPRFRKTLQFGDWPGRWQLEQWPERSGRKRVAERGLPWQVVRPGEMPGW